MLISGFTFVRNAIKLKYPIKEAILSILPICDEFVINVCKSEDDTLNFIKSIVSPKIKIIESDWDETWQSKGLLLSENTNIALNKCQGTWCFYIQGDEVVHEDDLKEIQNKCNEYKDNKNIEALVFNYFHFYGSYKVIATARNWYRREVRIIKNNIGAKSVGDAQGFKVKNNKPLGALLNARIFHYGWVRNPKDMGLKNKHFFRLWHGLRYDNAFDNFNFEQQYGLKYFTHSHPALMNTQIKSQNWDFKIDKTCIKWNLKNIRYFVSDIIEQASGIRLGEHKNFRLVK